MYFATNTNTCKLYSWVIYCSPFLFFLLLDNVNYSIYGHVSANSYYGTYGLLARSPKRLNYTATPHPLTNTFFPAREGRTAQVRHMVTCCTDSVCYGYRTSAPQAALHAVLVIAGGPFHAKGSPCRFPLPHSVANLCGCGLLGLSDQFWNICTAQCPLCSGLWSLT